MNGNHNVLLYVCPSLSRAETGNTEQVHKIYKPGLSV